MKQTPLTRRTPLRASAKPTKRRPISPASTAQRQRIAGRSCLVCGDSPCDAAHVIDRSLCPEGADDARAVVPLCRLHHREYDEHRLSLLEYLEPLHREELAFAVFRFGLVSTYNRLTGERL